MTRQNPVQDRSTLRLESLREAAKEAIKVHGIERFTTADIAKISGSSIGTVYRYFTDRVAVLDDLYPEREVRLTPDLLDAAKLHAALESSLASLKDTSLQNPRDRVRGARAIIENALGLTDTE